MVGKDWEESGHAGKCPSVETSSEAMRAQAAETLKKDPVGKP